MNRRSNSIVEAFARNAGRTPAKLCKKPRQVVFVDALPRDALGKVLKHEVREGLIEPEE
jgi:acyl-coenzyme A synthetase/AMP-(fatty) acid ligase